MAFILHQIEVAQAFDELSILEIKIVKAIKQEQKESFNDQIIILKKEIDKSLGTDLTERIYRSDFYTNLINANLNIFNSVDRFKASEPAQLNIKRIDAKRKLQEYFFNTLLQEVKI